MAEARTISDDKPNKNLDQDNHNKTTQNAVSKDKILTKTGLKRNECAHCLPSFEKLAAADVLKLCSSSP